MLRRTVLLVCMLGSVRHPVASASLGARMMRSTLGLSRRREMTEET